MDSFGQLSKSTGYRKNTLGFNGYGVGGLLYPPRTLPMWQNSFQECKNRFFRSPLCKSDRILAIFTKTSSVTKINIMGRLNMVVGIAYTSHQCLYSDRNDSQREKSTKNTSYALLKLLALNRSSQIVLFADLAICCSILHFGVEGSNQKPWFQPFQDRSFSPMEACPQSSSLC